MAAAFISAAAASACAAGAVPAKETTALAIRDDDSRNISFDEVEPLVEAMYIALRKHARELTPKEIVEMALRGFLKDLPDGRSRYLTPREAEDRDRRMDDPDFGQSFLRDRKIDSEGFRLRYAALESFTAKSAKEMADWASGLDLTETDGIILDLRGNGGGRVRAAAEIAGLWLGPNRLMAETVGRRGHKEAKNTPQESTGILKGVLTVILIDGQSASASEMLTAALQDYGQAVSVGTRSYGKGSMQRGFDLLNGGRAVMTTAYWTTPKGEAVQGKGIEPDFTVPLPPGLRYRHGQTIRPDPQLQKAINLLTSAARSKSGAESKNSRKR